MDRNLARKVFQPRAARPTSGAGPFNADRYAAALAVFVDKHPDLAPRAYAEAAVRFRLEAQRAKSAGERLQLQSLAANLDVLSAEAQIFPVDPDAGEEISPVSQTLGPDPTADDAELADLSASKVASDGTPNEDLAATHKFDQLQQARSADVAMPVQWTPVTPPRVPGRQVLVQYGGNSAIRALQEDTVFYWEGRQTEIMPVTLFAGRAPGRVTGATFPNTGLNYRPFLHIRWGVLSGAANEAYIDVGRGVQVCVCGNFVYGSVGMDAPPTGASAGSMALVGSMGFLAAGGARPLRSVYIDTLAPAGTQTIVIPPCAQTIEGLMSVVAPDFSFVIQDVNGSSLDTVNPVTEEPVVLSGDAYQVLVTNVSNNTAASCAVVFGLSLG